MKKIYSCLLILTYLTSCSSDIDTNVIDSPQAISMPSGTNAPSANRLAGEMPANSDNLYENGGHIYDQILTSYYNSVNLPTVLPRFPNVSEVLPMQQQDSYP